MKIIDIRHGLENYWHIATEYLGFFLMNVDEVPRSRIKLFKSYNLLTIIWTHDM